MIRITIENKEYTTQEIQRWQEKRVQSSKRKLKKWLKRSINVADADQLALFKSQIDFEIIPVSLKNELRFSSFCTGIVVRLSGKRRKLSVAEIDVDFCDAKTMHSLYDEMMLHNTPENKLCCLRANPDHYLLQGIGNDVQEVMEITGGLPVVSLFDICYGDFSGLRSEQEDDYPVQAAGVSYLKNGLAIGAVRHQMKDTPQGCHVTLTVEFPALMPKRNIRAHQYHLACEFYNWFTEFEKRVKEGKVQ